MALVNTMTAVLALTSSFPQAPPEPKPHVYWLGAATTCLGLASTNVLFDQVPMHFFQGQWDALATSSTRAPTSANRRTAAASRRRRSGAATSCTWCGWSLAPLLWEEKALVVRRSSTSRHLMWSLGARRQTRSPARFRRMWTLVS